MGPVRTELLVLARVHGGAGLARLAPPDAHLLHRIHRAATRRLGNQGTGRIQTLTVADTREAQSSSGI